MSGGHWGFWKFIRITLGSSGHIHILHGKDLNQCILRQVFFSLAHQHEQMLKFVLSALDRHLMAFEDHLEIVESESALHGQVVEVNLLLNECFLDVLEEHARFTPYFKVVHHDPKIDSMILLISVEIHIFF